MLATDYNLEISGVKKQMRSSPKKGIPVLSGVVSVSIGLGIRYMLGERDTTESLTDSYG